VFPANTGTGFATFNKKHERMKQSTNNSESASKSHTTTNPEEIRKWVEERKGKPATVKGTGKNDDAGILRIDFPGGAGDDKLENISWEEFFEKFEEQQLAFLYQEEKASGEQSYFSKFVSRDK
jgi:hypothetical protein